MPRTARGTVAGVCYHLINRGNRQACVYESGWDYAHFEHLMREAQSRHPLDIFGFCLMPNHFHLVARAAEDGDFAGWMHWLLTTHARQHHKRNQTSGRLWQGRFKAFPVQEDAHFLTVLRYVERNALRAGLVAQAEEWKWGSLHWRQGGDPAFDLAPSPVALPADWLAWVNAPQTSSELEALRICVNRQRPYGSQAWTQATAGQLGLTSSLRPAGRPPKLREKDKQECPHY